MSVLVWCGVGVLGALGSILRFELAAHLHQRTGGGPFPIGTFAVNLSGAFALGLLVGAGIGGDALILIGTGFLGAYTTFSTWMVDTRLLAGHGRPRVALGYLFGSLAGGLALAGLGWALGSLL